MKAAAKKLILKGLGLAGSLVSLPKLVSSSGYNLFLPFYHTVGSGLRHIDHLYPVRSEKQFRQDIDYVLKYFEPLDTEGLMQGIANGFPKSKRYFYLSFDDGLCEVYQTAFPILKEKGVPFTLFINPDFVGNKKLFFPHKASLILDALESKGRSEGSSIRKLLEKEGITYATMNKGLRMAGHQHEHLLDEAAEIIGIDFDAFLKNDKPYMTLDQIQELHNEGVMIGAHSMNHPLYNMLPLDEQISQTRDSIAFVQEHINEKYRLFSFPFTDSGVTDDFFKIIHDKDNPVADLTFGCAGLKKEIYPYHLQRVPMEAYAEPASRQIRGKYLYNLLLKMARKDKIRRA